MPKITVENAEASRTTRIRNTKILEAKGRGAETAELEARIDTMVYGVYGLEEGEIAVVEKKGE